jgi:osmotically-inducible protein OsmY
MFSIFKKLFIGRYLLIAFSALFFMTILPLTASDRNLVDRVNSALGTQYIQTFDVTEPEEGTILIEGEVETLYDKYQIFEIVAQVPGVEKVIPNVRVDTEMLPDDIIENNIRDELNLVSLIKEPDQINIKVNNGEVILSGKVSFYREKIMAKTVASWQEGVTAVINNIELLPAEKAFSDENLSDILQTILEDRFPTEDNVKFTVEDRIVTLSGKTQDLWARNQIEDAFASVIGIKAVDNNIKVDYWRQR